MFLTLKVWKDLCVSKDDGGLGFRLFHEINLALLAKLGCNIVRGECSYSIDLMCAKCFSSYTFFDHIIKKGASLVWRGIMSV